MKRPVPSDDPDEFGVEITSLDALETPVHASNALLQGTHLAPRVRLWLTILSVVGGLLLLVVVLSPVLSSLLSKKASTPPTFHVPPAQIQDVSMQNGIAYVTSSDGTFQALNEKNGSLIWKRNLGGIAPYFINNTIYTDRYSKQGSIVQALSAVNGSILWTFKTSLDITPLFIENGVVYTPFQNSSPGHILIALDGRNGSELWQYAMNVLPSLYGGIQATQDQIFISVWVRPQTPTQTPAMNLFVIKISDGSLLWHVKAENMQMLQNSTVGITTSDGILHLLRTDNGHEIWHYKSPNGANFVPYTGNGLLYMQTQNESLQVLKSNSGALLWTYNDPWGVAEVFPDTNGVLYIETGDGFIVALRTSDGKRLWHVQPIAPPFTVSSVQAAGGIVYTFTTVGASQSQTIAALRASDGSLLWRHNVDTVNNIPPLIINDQLFADTGTTISVLRGYDGVALWHANYTDTMTMQQDSSAFLDFADNIVILRLSDSVVEAHQAQTGAVLWRYPR